jgi:hypothetical protein
MHQLGRDVVIGKVGVEASPSTRKAVEAEEEDAKEEHETLYPIHDARIGVRDRAGNVIVSFDLCGHVLS